MQNIDSSKIIHHTQYDFHGGIHPEEFKQLSNASPIRDLPLPPQLIIPLNQHSGTQALPCVKVGDRVLKGSLIACAQGDLSANVHAPASGVVTHIEERPIAHPSGMSDLCIVINTDANSSTAYYTPIDNPFEASRQALLERIYEAGIVGMGGASFPSHIKLAAKVETLVINAAECEPYITCDDRLIQDRSAELIESFRLLQYILSAKNCIIGIEDNKPEAIKALEAAILEAKVSDISICVVPTKYPSGGEKQLIELITGQQVPSGKLTTSLELVMHNVATAYAVYQAITQGQPLISRITTLTGQACKKAGNYQVLIGTPFDWLFEQVDVQHPEQIVMGGPMMGFKVLDTSASVIKSTNCLIAAAKGELGNDAMALPCIRCGACADACPASLLPQQLYWFARSEEFDKAEEHNLFDCIECGACAYVCPSQIPLVHYYRFAKNEIVQRAKEKQIAAHARERFEFREYRLKREKAERAEKHRKAAEARKKAAEAKGQENEKKATIADAVARAKARKQEKKDNESS